MLRDVTIIATSGTLRHLARFLEQAADKIDEHGGDFDHDHYALFVGRALGEKYWGGDVTLLHPSVADREDRGDAFLSMLPPLGRAARLGDEAVVRELLAAGEDPNQANEYGYSSLLGACDALTPGIVEQLLDAGANVEAAAFGFTPLMSAAGGGNLEICRMLLAAGADARARSDPPVPDTALDCAARGGHAEVVRWLLELGVKADDGGDDELTPLMQAAELGHHDVVKVLLEEGADPFRAYDGSTSLDMAHERLHAEVAALLAKWMQRHPTAGLSHTEGDVPRSDRRRST